MAHILVSQASDRKLLCYVKDKGDGEEFRLPRTKPSEVIEYFYPGLPDKVHCFYELTSDEDYGDYIIELTKLLRSEENVTEPVQLLKKVNFYYDTESAQVLKSWSDVEYDFIVAERIRNEKELDDMFDSLPDRTPDDQ